MKYKLQKKQKLTSQNTEYTLYITHISNREKKKYRKQKILQLNRYRKKQDTEKNKIKTI